MKDEYKKLVFTPSEISDAYVQYAERIRQHAENGLTWGVPSMDKAIIPLRPGDVIGIIARPGHGKSSLAAYLAKRTARSIMQGNGRGKQCVIFCTFEQTVEECEAFFQSGQQYNVSDFAWGRVPMDLIIKQSIERINLPVWLMGRSLVRRREAPRMTIENIYRAIDSLEKSEADGGYGIKPALVIIDYIQIVPVENARERVQQVGEAILQSKELAANIGAPVVVCVQARREVDSYKVKIPTASDCQWASAIEQAADKLLGIWRPCLTHAKSIGDQVEVAGRKVTLTQNLFVAKLLKQRWYEAGQVFLLHFDPAAVKLADLELRYSDPPPLGFG